MRALLQRVSRAEVLVGGAPVGSVDAGLLVFVGVGLHDTSADARWLCNKVTTLRLFDSSAGAIEGLRVVASEGAASGEAAGATSASAAAPRPKPWTHSVQSLGLSVLCVSQFTLHASSRKTKPDFHRSAGAGPAKVLFDEFVELCRATKGVGRVETGTFGAMMQVTLANEGPVTIWLDSHNREDSEWRLPSTAPSAAGDSASDH